VRFASPLPGDAHLVVSVLADLLVTAEAPPTAASLAALSPLRIRISPDRTLTVPFEVSAD
jgi:hypothetical protein